MFGEKEIRKNNAIVAAGAIDLGLQVLSNLKGGMLGNTDEDLAAILTNEINNEVINRRDHNAK